MMNAAASENLKVLLESVPRWCDDQFPAGSAPAAVQNRFISQPKKVSGAQCRISSEMRLEKNV